MELKNIQIDYKNKNGPIGIFDSGIGGLTVAKAIKKILPNEHIIYFGDVARLPYGNKSKETILRFAKEDVEFLLRFNVKIIVSACFTVSSNAIDELRDYFKIPIIDMIEPAVISIKKIKDEKIGVIGTIATVESETFLKKMKEKKIYQKACPLFVPIVEEGLFNHKIALFATEEYLKDFKKKHIQTIVLACTHYPLMKKTIKRYLGKNLKFIEPGYEVGKILKNILINNNALNDKNGSFEIYLSDLPRKSEKILNIFLGNKFKYTINKITL